MRNILVHRNELECVQSVVFFSEIKIFATMKPFKKSSINTILDKLKNGSFAGKFVLLSKAGKICAQNKVKV